MVALVLAAVAFGCAVVGALLPSEHLRETYSWPPPNLPAGQADRAWYAPLLVARHRPESISARLPCSVPRPLPRASRPVVVLATARNAPAIGGLQVTQVGRELTVSVGNDTIERLPLPADGPLAERCEYRLEFADGRSTVEGDTSFGSREGSVEMPVVSGLFSSVDLREGQGPSIVVTTEVYGSRTTAAQVVFRSLAVLAALAALILVSWASIGRPRFRERSRPLRRAAAQVRLVDGVVAVVLLGWWLIGPAYFDDGWVAAVQRNFGATGDQSTYYDSFGVASSLQYWLVWIQHELFERSIDLLVLRLPALLCLALTWVLCRWIYGRMSTVSTRTGRWTLVTAFLTGALAWGMTLRPEPVVALLATGVVACTVLFVERQTTAPLAIAAVLVSLAVSAHPAGLVALAPLVVVSPRLLAWARTRWTAVATIALAAAALFAVLAFLSSDLAQFRADVTSLRTFGVQVSGWRDELSRYSLLSREGYGAPIRRLWVALSLLAVLAYLLRPRGRPSGPMLGLPAAGLGVALVMLIPTPSKLPWHFGCLIGLAALALAAETERLVHVAKRSRSWHVRPFVILGAAMLAAAWAWFPRNAWGELDLRTMDWTLGLEDRLTLAKAAGITPVLLLGALALVELARRRRLRELHDVPWRAALLTVPLLTIPLIAFTTGVLVADTAKTSSWTLLRQNADALRGDSGCGLGDGSLVPTRASMRPLAAVGTTVPEPASWLPPPPLQGLPRFELAPKDSRRPARSPWFRLPSGDRVGFFIVGVPSFDEAIELEWGRAGGAGVTPLAVAPVASDLVSDARPELRYWRFHADGSLPPAPAGANAVRFSVRTGGPSGAGIGFTAPVTYTDETLASMLEREVPPLVLPNLLTYVPCVELPVLRGIASVPTSILATRDSMWPLGTGTSPFEHVTDLYPLVRLPLTDSPDPPEEVTVYVVEQRVEGEALLPPVSQPAT